MGKELFREKSLKKLNSPEQLDEYIRVSRPSVWLLVIGVMFLLIGACVWGFAGQADSTAAVIVRVDGEKTVCYVSEEDADAAEVGQSVAFLDETTEITAVVPQEGSGYLCILSPTPDIPDGLYQGEIVLKSYRPISFILN